MPRRRNRRAVRALNVPHYPPAVTGVGAVDPATIGRQLAAKRVAPSNVPVEYVDLDGHALALESRSIDHVLTTWTNNGTLVETAALATKRKRPMSSTPPSGLMSERDDAMEAVADMGASPETSRITHLFAGVPVSDLDANIDWYTRLFGRPPDRRVGHEMLWEMDEHAWLFIEPNATPAGAGRITLAVSGLDAFLERVAVEGIEHEPIETYSNGVRHVKIPGPDGNAIAFAEPPDAT